LSGAASPDSIVPPALDLDSFVAMAAQLGHGKVLGFSLKDSGPDWVELALPWRAELVADEEAGIFASAAVVSLIDMAGGTACWVRMGRFVPIATIDLRVDYLRAAERGETVIARGECHRLTRSVGFTRGQAHGGDPSRPIASFAATYMINP
jgi:uncharacterized protein (TIGR00369 family)